MASDWPSRLYLARPGGLTDMNWRPEAERPQAIREALQQIEAEIPRLRRYARYLGYEPDHADDLVREGLVRAVAEVPTAIAKIHTGRRPAPRCAAGCSPS